MTAFRRTKIVATLGPASNSKEKIELLMDTGVNIFRLNASHGKPEEHLQSINYIKELRQQKQIPVAILMDLQGPKIRVGNLENGGPIDLIEGKDLIITPECIIGNTSCISTNYSDIAKDVKIGDKILLSDGLLILEVKEILGHAIRTTIINGGKLFEHKGVNIPGTTSSLSAVSEKDHNDLIFAVKNDVDYIGLSFVRTGEDIKHVKQYIKQAGGDIPVIAKIEKPQALDNIDEILEVTDGVMVARGDLGIELAPEKVPLAQKRLIQLANINNKFVITATQMLESMVENPLPSRAEVSDVANAILDGTDAVMLSEETSVGKFPDRAVKMMTLIAEEIESDDIIDINKVIPLISSSVTTESHAIAFSAVEMSIDLNPQAIVAFTGSGFTARLLSRFRPAIPIIAITHQEKVYRQLSSYWGVCPHILDIDIFSEDTMDSLNNLLIEKTCLKSGDKIILVGGMPYLVTGITNFIYVHTIK